MKAKEKEKETVTNQRKELRIVLDQREAKEKPYTGLHPEDSS